MGTFALDSPTPGIFYIIFYVVAFFIGLLLLLREGQRRGYAMNLWMLTILSGFVFFVIGCKIFVFSHENWSEFVRSGEVSKVTGRSLIGGLLFGLGGIVLAVRWFRLPWTVLDSFALLIPVTLLFQRIGCFLAGCCYGTPTSLPWAVTYGEEYHAFHDHVAAGVADAAATQALPVHPVQLYEVAGCILIIMIVTWVTKTGLFKADGSLLLFSTMLYGIVRFCDEFFRAAHMPLAMGLNKVQWLVALIAAFCLVMIVVAERKPATPGQSLREGNTFRSEFLFFLLIGGLYSVSWSVLDTLEVLALYPVMVFSTLSVLVSAFQHFTFPATRMAMGAMLMLSLSLMSQIAPEKERKNLEQHHYYTIAVDMLAGKHTLNEELVGGDCDGNPSYTLASFQEKYVAGGLNVSRTDVYGTRKLSYGIGSQIGKLEERGESNINSQREINFYAITPYVRYDLNYFGIGGGVSIGDMPVIRNRFDKEQATLIRRYHVYPQFYVRGGSLQKFFGEFRFGEGFAGAFPASQYQVLAGYGFNRDSGAAIRIGTSSRAGVVLSGVIPAGGHLLIEPYIGFGESIFGEYTSEKNAQGALRLAYRFGHK